MGLAADWDRLVLVATSAWVLPFAPPKDAAARLASVPSRCMACVHPGEQTGGATPPRVPLAAAEHWQPPVVAAVARQESLLRDLTSAGRPGWAYVSRAADPGSRYSMQSRVDSLPSREFAAPAAAESFVDSVLGRLERHLVVHAEDWAHPEPFVLRHRVIVDRPRFEAVTGFAPPEPTKLQYFVTLDFRLVRAFRFQRWHLSIVVWSELPFSVEHRPVLTGESDWRLREADEVVLQEPSRHYRDLFEAAARHTERWLEQRGWEHSWLNISGRRYMHPDFWVAVPSVRTDPYAYAAEAGRRDAEIASTMLRVDSMSDDTVSASVINGDYLVLRRIANGLDDGGPGGTRTFRPSRNPLYLVIVGDAAWFRPTRGFHVDADANPLQPGSVDDRACPHHDRCRRFEYVARQEFCMRDLIDALADMEAYAAFTLYDVYTDMQVWENHLAVYETTAAAGGRIWDSLATHLPIRRMRQLGRVHHAVDLMHQTLLQGIADLNDLTMLSRACAASVERARQTLGERFDDVLVQRRGSGIGHDDLRQAMSQTGIFAQLTATAGNLVQHAERVAERYQDLIDAVKDAFDERRVREGDAIQKAGVLLAVSLAFDSIVNIVAVAEPQASGEQASWVPPLAFASAGVVLTTALVFAVWFLRLGRLGDRTFRARYDGRPPGRATAFLGRLAGLLRFRSRRRDTRLGGLWRFMKNSSTDALEGHRRSGHGPEFWDSLDDRLAADLAAVWDAPQAAHAPKSLDPYAPAGRPDIVSDDISALFVQVGNWSVHALLFTERARRLYRYPLPKLTLLYRCIARMPGSYLHLEHLTTTPSNIVSEAELHRVLRRYARARETAPRDQHDIELGQALDQLLVSKAPASAAAALAMIDDALALAIPRTRRTAEA